MNSAWEAGLDSLWQALGEPADKVARATRQARFNAAVRSLIADGWTRGDLHAAVDELCQRPGVSDRVVDDLDDLDTALTGWCAPESIIRFPGDPDDEGALVGHVRGAAWKADCPVRDAGRRAGH